MSEKRKDHKGRILRTGESPVSYTHLLALQAVSVQQVYNSSISISA